MKKGLLMAFGLLVVSSLASATTITGTVVVYGNVPTINAPGSNTTSAAQFDVNSVNAAIQAGCAAGHTCSSAYLYQIDYTLTANVSASVTINNTTGSTQYISALGTDPGTYAGGATSGTAVKQKTTVVLTDANNGALVAVIPTFSIATTNRFKTTCGGSGTVNSSNFVNCLAVGTGSTVKTGTGTDTKTGSLADVDYDPTDWLAVVNQYSGTGVITFGLGVTGGTDAGTLPTGVTIPTNTGQIQALTGGLAVTYNYSYDETLTPSDVPEPSTMALFGSAILAAGVFGRRFKK